MLVRKTKKLKTGMNITFVFQAKADTTVLTGERLIDTAIMEAGYMFVFDYPGSTTVEYIPNVENKKCSL